MIRAFIAVNIADVQRKEIAEVIDSFRRYDVRVKWVNAGNLHVTMKFLGETSEDSLTEMYSAIRDSIAGVAPFNLRLANVGCFPNARKPRVIWVGINDGFNQLKDISRCVENALEPFGFAPEKRKFAAHVTIGRVKDNRNIETLSSELDRIKFDSSDSQIRDVVFYQSDLRPQGPIYTALQAFELGV